MKYNKILKLYSCMNLKIKKKRDREGLLLKIKEIKNIMHISVSVLIPFQELLKLINFNRKIR